MRASLVPASVLNGLRAEWMHQVRSAASSPCICRCGCWYVHGLMLLLWLPWLANSVLSHGVARIAVILKRVRLRQSLVPSATGHMGQKSAGMDSSRTRWVQETGNQFGKGGADRLAALN